MTAEYPGKTKFEPGRGYTEEDWNAVDSPQLTKEELAKMRPAKEVLPQSFFEGLEEARRLRGRPKTGHAKEAVTLRLDAETIERFKRAGGPAWRSLMASAIEKARP